MRNFRRAPEAFFIALLLMVVHSCSLLLHSPAVVQDADAAFEAGEYEEALRLYGQYIDAQKSRNRDVNGAVLNRAGVSAFELGQTQAAIDYLELARHTPESDALTYATLAKAYRTVDNLSREISNLERYLEAYPGHEEADVLRKRLFIALVESRNWHQAADLWLEFPGEKYKDEALMTGFLKVNRALENTGKASDLADMLLDLNPRNTEALDYLGRKHFDEAISRYNREMRAYEQNRTHRQYAKLLEAFEIMNTDFRIALNYFLRLYEQDPRPEYASFLANIYERFQDEERARYFRSRAR